MGIFAGTPWDLPPRCERCERLESECDCPPLPAAVKQWLPPEKQSCRIQVEKRNKGKWVTVVRGLKSEECDMASLLKLLKNHCGAGGSIDGDLLEIQGDHSQRMKTKLIELGYRCK